MFKLLLNFWTRPKNVIFLAECGLNTECGFFLKFRYCSFQFFERLQGEDWQKTGFKIEQRRADLPRYGFQYVSSFFLSRNFNYLLYLNIVRDCTGCIFFHLNFLYILYQKNNNKTMRGINKGLLVYRIATLAAVTASNLISHISS
jgi:hypothetical protein